MKDSRFTGIGVSRLRMVTDGEGITTLVVGSGCPLRCKYCLNPQCILENYENTKTWELKDLIDFIKIDDLYFKATGGGVTFGGGEPLLQAKFIHEFRKECPKEWKINLESSLAVPFDNIQLIWDDIDTFLIDIKDMNSDIYKSYTGEDNTEVKANLRRLIDHVGAEKVTVRIPLIEGYNTEADRTKSVEELKELGAVKFDLFTYDLHRGASKI